MPINCSQIGVLGASTAYIVVHSLYQSCQYRLFPLSAFILTHPSPPRVRLVPARAAPQTIRSPPLLFRGWCDPRWRPDLWYMFPGKGLPGANRFLWKLPSNNSRAYCGSYDCPFVGIAERLEMESRGSAVRHWGQAFVSIERSGCVQE